MIASAVCTRLFALSQNRPLTGAVHSVFDHAVNLEITDRVGLIGLIAEHKALTPYAVSVQGELPFTRTGLCAGMATAIREGRILIPQADISIDLSKAKQVDLSVDSIRSSDQRNTESLKKAIVAALKSADAENSLASLVTGQKSNVYSDFLAPRLETLFAAVASGEKEAALEAVRRVAGCGTGLTPSSDDLLCGYLVTLRWLAQERRRDDAFMALSAVAQAAAEKTNRISATFLLQSGEWLANDAVVSLLRTVSRTDGDEAVKQAAGRVLAIGSTSGADILTGMYLALGQNNGGNEL